MTEQYTHHVVIIGGGFGGLYAAKKLSHPSIKVTLIDKRNFHLFQPLLYQVAAGWLSPGDIASPLRSVLNGYKNIYVIKAEARDILPREKKIMLRDGELSYDSLIVATGSTHHYFGNDQWSAYAPGLKTVEDALTIRRNILLSFEAAEREPDPLKQMSWMTFIIVGAGPSGVEMAGTIGELATTTLRGDFRNINTTSARIILIEGQDRVLPTYPPDLSDEALKSLNHLGVEIRLNTMVTNISQYRITVVESGVEDYISSRTVLWTAGVKASGMGRVLGKATGSELDSVGRVVVSENLTVPGEPDIFVIGDLAHSPDKNGNPLPGVAPVAMQQGLYVAELIKKRLEGKESEPFVYKDKGSLSVIGRNKAVADLGGYHLSGFLAWVMWVFIHIRYLIEFDNQLIVLFRWGWNYFTRRRGARLITGDDFFPLINDKKPDKNP